VRRIDRLDEAADVLAETFLVAWRRLDQVPDGERAGLWLYGVARRNLANQRRGEHRRTQLADRLRAEIPVDGSIAEPPGAGTAGAFAFRSLSDGDRELLTLSGWEGLDPGEIGVVLRCSRNAARIRLHRARRRLRAALAAARAGEHATTSPGGSTRAESESPSPSGHLNSDERSTALSLDLIVDKGENS
jgi:RNA polymerase sigma factor (sigma-70 family)